MFLIDRHTVDKSNDKGGALLHVMVIVAVIGIAGGVVATRAKHRLEVAHNFAMRSDAQRILDYYAGAMRHRAAWQQNLKASHNPALHRYVVTRPTGDTPPPACPRVENCKSSPPTSCPIWNYDPPPCAAEPPWLVMTAFDSEGKVLIPSTGVNLSADLEPLKEGGTARWLLRAFWSKQTNYQAHCRLQLSLVRPDGPLSLNFKKASLTFPVKQCFTHKSEKFRDDWNPPVFPGWRGVILLCPNNYEMVQGQMMLHPRNVYFNGGLPQRLWKDKERKISIGRGLNAGVVQDTTGSVDVSTFVNLTGPETPSNSPPDIDIVAATCCWQEDDFKFEQ